MCGVKFRLHQRSRRIHNYLEEYQGCRFKEKFAEFNISTTQNGSPTIYKVDDEQEYETD